ncbi:MAG: hypothetical protein ACPL7M_00250 [Bryobacteraceae bacterium]
MKIPTLPAFAVLFAMAAATAQENRFYFGVKSGLLLTDNRESAFRAGRGATFDSRLGQNRFSIGPSVEVALPGRFRLESGFLYRRFSRSETVSTGPAFWQTELIRGSRWEVPLVLSREWGARRIRPFLGAGGAWSHVPPPETVVTTFNELGPPPFTPAVIRTRRASDNTGGLIVAGGLRLRGPARIRFTPEVRFTRWTSGQWLPSRNQVDLFLGIGF